MKKILPFLLIGAMLFTVGCTCKISTDDETTAAPTSIAATTVTQTQAPTPASTKNVGKAEATLYIEEDDGYIVVENFASKNEMSFDDKEDLNEANAESDTYKVKVDAYNVVIPETVKGNNVQVINDDAFQNCSLIKSITIPETVRMIENGAFSGCSKDLVLIVKKDSAGLEHAKKFGIKYKIVK